MKYNMKVEIFRGSCDTVQHAINDWFSIYAINNGGMPVVTNILQTEADTNTLTISIFYNHGEKSQ